MRALVVGGSRFADRVSAALVALGHEVLIADSVPVAEVPAPPLDVLLPTYPDWPRNRHERRAAAKGHR